MNLDFNAITAGATVIAVFVAIYAIWVEHRRSRFSQGVELILRLSDMFFYSKEFTQYRREAARYLKKNLTLKASNKKTKSNIKPDVPSSIELDAILDFFEGMEMLVDKAAIDKELAWSYFYWWLSCYYALSKDYIEFWQNKDPNIWEGVIWLHKRLVKIENKENPQGYQIPSTEDLLVFIKHEMNLKYIKD